MADIQTPHFSLPFRFHNGRVVVNEQDEYDEIADCVQAIVRYSRGQRAEFPDFGVTQQEFAIEIDRDKLIDQVQEHEPRIQLIVEPAEIDQIDEMIQTVILGIVVNNPATGLDQRGGSRV